MSCDHKAMEMRYKDAHLAVVIIIHWDEKLSEKRKIRPLQIQCSRIIVVQKTEMIEQKSKNSKKLRNY